MSVSVIIPNWNGAKLLKKHLPAVVAAKKNLKNEIKEIIVVDDGSTDNSLEVLEKEFSKDVRVIKQKHNRGFSSTVNLGVRKSNGRFVCLLNSDVSPTKKFLVSVLPKFRNKDVCGVTFHEKGFGPAVGYFADGYLQHKSGEETDKQMPTLWVSGGSGIFRKKTWQKLSGFDGDLYKPFYWEDVDFGYRAGKRGYKLIWDPKATVDHQHESTINPSRFRSRYIVRIKERNQLLFVWKNITSKTLFSQHVSALISRMTFEPGYILIVLMALMKINVVLKRREKEKSESIISDEALLSKFADQ